MRNNSGFTLIEIMITLGISLTMLLAIYGIINTSQRSSVGMERVVAAQQDEKTALELMSMEIAMASFNPLFVSDNLLWLNPDTCSVGDFSANPTYKGIQVATANSIAIQMDTFIPPPPPAVTENGVIGDPNEIISYNYDTANLRLTRETNCGGGQPFLGETAASGRPRTVRVINNNFNPVIPVFRYYNGAGTDISATVVTNPASPTLGIPAIRRIEIILAVETESADPNTGKRKTIIYSTSVIVRNHAPRI